MIVIGGSKADCSNRRQFPRVDSFLTPSFIRFSSHDVKIDNCRDGIFRVQNEHKNSHGVENGYPYCCRQPYNLSQ